MKKTILKAINETRKLIEHRIRSESLSIDYMPLYMFTTENIKGVTESLDVYGRDVFTVCASSDHEFNFLLRGAKSVETFDVNYLTDFYYWFKESAVLTLEYEEFIDFFFPKFMFSFRKKTFNEKDFMRIIDNIRDEDVKEYWRGLVSVYGCQFLYSSNLFLTFYNKKTYIECNDYLKNKENYNKLRDRLKSHKHKFYHLNIFSELSEMPKDKKYQVIYLSNILNSFDGMDELSCVRKIKDIIDRFKLYLTKDGVIGICYLYCYLDEQHIKYTPNNILNPDLRRKHFPDSKDVSNSGYNYPSFNGFNDIDGRRSENRDAVMVTRK